jgi:HK97 family phage major capsid protein
MVALKASLAKPVNVPGNTPKASDAKIPATARVRYSKLHAFRGDQAEEKAFRSGMFLRATLLGDTRASEWCKEHGVQIVKAQSESQNSAGGFLVPTEFEQAIIDLREEYGTFRRECKLVPMGSDSMSIPRRAGGLTAYFVAENTAITESQKTWDQVTLTAKKIACLARMSTELADDAVINIADDLAAEMGYAFAQLEDSCGWNGDGTSTYGGIVGVRTKIINGGYTKSAIDAASPATTPSPRSTRPTSRP